MNCFLTGTDTEVGKTYAAALWIRTLRRIGMDAVGMKPICCGDRGDATALFDASGGVAELDVINPVWFRTPAAPYVAAAAEDRVFDLAGVIAAYRRLRSSHQFVIVEGAGGWLTPIRRDYLMADLATDLDLPAVIVVRNRLGALNHTLLTLREMRSRGVVCAGLIFNHMEEKPDSATTTNRAALEDLAQVPVLFEITRGQTTLEFGLA